MSKRIALSEGFHAEPGETPGHLHDVYTTVPPLGGNKRIHVGTLTKAGVEAWAKAGSAEAPDTSRLDFLDACNRRLNASYGTTYRWRLILNHNVNRLMLGSDMKVDLHDSDGSNDALPSCRDAIDAEMRRIEQARKAAPPAEQDANHGGER